MRPPIQLSSSSVSGTRVVLPAPGGAEITSRVASRSAATISGITSSIGRSDFASIAPEVSAEGLVVDQHFRADHDQDQPADDFRLGAERFGAGPAYHHARGREGEGD